MKKTELEHLCSTGTALIAACKVDDSMTEAEGKLLGIETCWDDLLKALDDKEKSLLAIQIEVDKYSNLLNQFGSWMDGVQKKPNEPIDLISDPHKMADKLEEMKVVSFHIIFII